MSKMGELFKESYDGSLNLKYYTTKPTTGITKGDLLLLFHGSRPILGVCTSSGGKQIKMVTLKNTTVGRLSNG